MTTTRTKALRSKKLYLKLQGDGIHTYYGATYEVKDGKYRQVYAAGHPASGWRKL